ncbi:MAG TPA: hypothetical protein VMU55_06305 [Solirubrobacteraceae bacterium]|nr:hypothetical protein [Solirubrobacteraceae bacterium]
MDFRYSNHGSISLLEPVSEAAWHWVIERIAVEANQMWFGHSLVIEHRYVPPILEGIRADGLEVA